MDGTFAISHHERSLGMKLEGGFPLPTEALGLRRLWLWSLPGRAITLLSIVSFVLAGVGLSCTRELRLLYRLPAPAWLLAAGAAALAALVAWAGRGRPGHLLPRLWPLALAGCGGLLAFLAPAPGLGDLPILHALTAASAAGASVLLLRLARPAATSRWTEWIVLAATGFTALLLGLGLPLAVAAARASWEAQISTAVAELRAAARAARLAAGPEEDATEADWRAAEASLEAVALHHPTRWMRSERLWRAASTLGRERELAAAAKDTLAMVSTGLSAERAPSLGRLAWPAVWFDHERRIWVRDRRFEARSRFVGRYYRELGGLFSELHPPAAATPGSRELATLFAAEWRQWQLRLHELLPSWSEGWVAARVPGGRDLAGAARLELGELLDQPILRAQGRALRPVELWSLMSLPGRDAWPIGAHPGCLRHLYAEEAIGIFRADCFAYAPSRDGDGAELLIEVRLVYHARTLLLDFDRVQPQEVYLRFPVPGSAQPEAYRGEVMTALARAVEIAHPRLSFEADRSGTGVKGFRLMDSRRSLRVHSRATAYLEGRQAVEVRACWE